MNGFTDPDHVDDTTPDSSRSFAQRAASAKPLHQSVNDAGAAFTAALYSAMEKDIMTGQEARVYARIYREHIFKDHVAEPESLSVPMIPKDAAVFKQDLASAKLVSEAVADEFAANAFKNGDGPGADKRIKVQKQIISGAYTAAQLAFDKETRSIP